MTTAQRIGQLFLLGLADDRLGSAELAAIRNEHVGSVWFTAQTSIGVAGIRAIADAVQAQVNPASTADVGFFVAANQEGGLIQALAGPGFSTVPSALVQGARPLGTLTADALAWGRQLRSAGVNLDFAPARDGGDADLRLELEHDFRRRRRWYDRRRCSSDLREAGFGRRETDHSARRIPSSLATRPGADGGRRA